jgi:UDP-N-acetylglucosamine 2-epimerase (non-hydrolysing)
MERVCKILTVLGTRPDAIKLAPVIKELGRGPGFKTVNVNSGQHAELLHPLISLFQLRIDHNLNVYRRHQTPEQICGAVTQRMLPIIDAESPDLILVQGDTSTAIGAAEAAVRRKVPIGHVEAGLRSGDESSPFPEEIYRKTITSLVSYHFAPTTGGRSNLLMEGVPANSVLVTGNTVVDSLRSMLRGKHSSGFVRFLLNETSGLKRIVLTMHRRENLHRLPEIFKVLRRFVETNTDACLIFPVHPNPNVRKAAAILAGCPRIRLIAPLRYDHFIQLLRQAWVIVTDSGGIQEEAPTLGKHVVLVRSRTERPEALASFVTLAGDSPASLLNHLGNVPSRVKSRRNPFGSGGSAVLIADFLQSMERWK